LADDDRPGAQDEDLGRLSWHPCSVTMQTSRISLWLVSIQAVNAGEVLVHCVDRQVVVQGYGRDDKVGERRYLAAQPQIKSELAGPPPGGPVGGKIVRRVQSTGQGVKVVAAPSALQHLANDDVSRRDLVLRQELAQLVRDAGAWLAI